MTDAGMKEKQPENRTAVLADNSMQDGFGRKIDEEIYWKNTGLSAAAIARIKERKKRK